MNKLSLNQCFKDLSVSLVQNKIANRQSLGPTQLAQGVERVHINHCLVHTKFSDNITKCFHQMLLCFIDKTEYFYTCPAHLLT
jgi:hypothetical protein